MYMMWGNLPQIMCVAFNFSNSILTAWYIEFALNNVTKHSSFFLLLVFVICDLIFPHLICLALLWPYWSVSLNNDFAIWNETESHYSWNKTKFTCGNVFLQPPSGNIEHWLMVFRTVHLMAERLAHLEFFPNNEWNVGNPLVNWGYISITFLRQLLQKWNDFFSFLFKNKITINI